MPFDGNGNYSLPPGTEGVPGTTIDAEPYNAFLADLTSALSGLLLRSGAAAMTGNLPMGSNRITGLGAGVSDTDAVTKEQLDDAIAGVLADVADDITALGQIPIVTDQLTAGKCFATASNVLLAAGLTPGNVYEVLNTHTAAIQILPDTGVTIELAGTTVTGTLLLNPKGLAYIKPRATNTYLVTGPGVSP